MKQGIHPTYYKDAKVICACGATFLVGSTEKEMKVEICSNCHPFYTGKQKLVDTAGRVDKFKARMEAASKAKAVKNAPKVKGEVVKKAEEKKVKAKSDK
jgi:large subunit ribosomal protein L31